MERHCCKVCGRSFQSGRSLGGHMRSHVVPSSDGEEKLAKRYGLRENPKKTWRFDDVLLEMEKDHKLCGKPAKIFSSWNKACDELGGEDQENSWITGVDGEDEEMELQTGSEVTAVAVPRGRRQGRRSRRVDAISSSSSPPPSSPEYVTKEQEDGALCLMMLSRDTGSVTELSDKNSAVMEWEHNISESDTPRIGCDDEVKTEKKKNLNVAVLGSKLVNSSKRSSYECTACNKSFHSYQALGGHCASHKKFKGDPSSNSPATEQIMVQKFRTHECPICGKVFASGQALGGHKRSHLIVGTIPVAEMIERKQKDSELNALDLNLPASESCRLLAFLD